MYSRIRRSDGTNPSRFTRRKRKLHCGKIEWAPKQNVSSEGEGDSRADARSEDTQNRRFRIMEQRFGEQLLSETILACAYEEPRIAQREIRHTPCNALFPSDEKRPLSAHTCDVELPERGCPVRIVVPDNGQEIAVFDGLREIGSRLETFERALRLATRSIEDRTKIQQHGARARTQSRRIESDEMASPPPDIGRRESDSSSPTGSEPVLHSPLAFSLNSACARPMRTRHSGVFASSQY